MLVLPDYSRPYIIETVHDPVVIKHNWMFSGPMLDFMLTPITYLEETTAFTSVKLRVNGTELWVPESWYVLVTDPETLQVDTVAMEDLAKRQYLAFSFSPDEANLRTLDLEIIDASGRDAPPKVFAHPMIPKGTALCHPVGPSAPMRNGKIFQLCFVVGPHDLYKFLVGKVVGDILSY